MRLRTVMLIVAAASCRSNPANLSPIAAGSGSDVRDPFAIPGSTILCRRTEPPRSAPPGLIGFEFEDGRLTLEDRLIRAAYDSSGQPTMLVVTATEESIGGVHATHVLSASFPTKQPASGFRVLHPEKTYDTATEPLSASSLQQARELAVWLWAHRCASESSSTSELQTLKTDNASVSWPRRILWFYAIIGLIGMTAMAAALWR